MIQLVSFVLFPTYHALLCLVRAFINSSKMLLCDVISSHCLCCLFWLLGSDERRHQTPNVVSCGLSANHHMSSYTQVCIQTAWNVIKLLIDNPRMWETSHYHGYMLYNLWQVLISCPCIHWHFMLSNENGAQLLNDFWLRN